MDQIIPTLLTIPVAVYALVALAVYAMTDGRSWSVALSWPWWMVLRRLFRKGK